MEDKLPVILLVDDDPSIRSLATTILSKQVECELAEAADGKEALNYCRTNRPDLVLLDMIMPEMDGFETGIKLKRKNIPFIAMTSLIDTETILRVLEIGSFSFLAKPVSEAQLTGTVLAALSHLKHIQALENYAETTRDICTARGAISAYLSIHPDQAFDVIHEMGRDQHGNVKDIATIVNQFLAFMAGANQKLHNQQTRRGKKTPQ